MEYDGFITPQERYEQSIKVWFTAKSDIEKDLK